MARKKFKKIYRYNCSLTGEEYKVTAESKSPDDLISVKAFYEMNPERDDRPEHIKAQLQAEEEE